MTECASTTWRGPFRALLWKERRESWWVLLLLILAPMTWHLYMPGEPQQEWVFVTPVYMFVALCAGARLFAGEQARGTAPFRDECPVARETVWAAATFWPLRAIAAGAMFKCALAYTGVFGFRPPDLPLFLVQLMAEGLFAFAVGALLSVLMDRPVTAVAAGAVICTAVVVLLAAATLRGGAAEWRSGAVWVLTLGMGAAGALALWLSRRVFARRR